MARTKRKKVYLGLRYCGWYGEVFEYRTKYYRNPKTFKTQKMEMNASEQLKEHGFIKNRVSARGNPSSSKIVHAGMDIHISALHEIVYMESRARGYKLSIPIRSRWVKKLYYW